jgi:hypothetical protein
MPRILTQGSKPNALALKIARLLGDHVGDEQLRRRARLIQNLIQTAGPWTEDGTEVDRVPRKARHHRRR